MSHAEPTQRPPGAEPAATPRIDSPLSAAARWLAGHHATLSNLRGRGLVVKLGGSIQDEPERLRRIARDLAVLAHLGARPVLVHGGGKAITAAMGKAGLPARFVQGQRYTDEATLAIAERVLAGTINRELRVLIEAEGVRAEGLHTLGTCVLLARRQGTDAAPGRPAEDLGLVGRVTRVNAPVLLGLCAAGVIPVIAPLALDEDDALRTEADAGPVARLNVNADLAAGTVAAALKPARFVLLSDTPGVKVETGAFAGSLGVSRLAGLEASGTVAGGMMPKLRACEEALRAGVERVAIVDGRIDHALLEAVLAEDEPIPGTWVTRA